MNKYFNLISDLHAPKIVKFNNEFTYKNIAYPALLFTKNNINIIGDVGEYIIVEVSFTVISI